MPFDPENPPKVPIIRPVPDPKKVPNQQEAKELVCEALLRINIQPEACTILDVPHNLTAPRDDGGIDQFPVFGAIVKESGMVLLFAVLGEHGLYQRFRDRQKKKSEPELPPELPPEGGLVH